MFFASDNTAGVSERIMEALAAANHGNVPSYGGDELTARLESRFAEVFEHEVVVFTVATGTAANALSLATMAPPWTAVLCHHDAHVMTDECGALEMYSGGARPVGVDGACAKMDVKVLAERLASWPSDRPHVLQPSALTISQATEFGAVWKQDEIGLVGELARRHKLRLHMDGARFANAVAALDCPPADITWRVGVDALSFGATKNGAMAAEAIVLFDRKLANTLPQRRMRAGHLISKGRFVAAQLLAYLAEEHWLDLARHANAMSRGLADAVESSDRARLAAPVEANEAFVFLDDGIHRALQKAGAKYYDWAGVGPGLTGARDGEALYRLVTSFRTTPEEISRFTEVLDGA